MSKLVEPMFWGALINSGQTCGALKRLYVHESVHDKVVEALVAYAKNIPMGDGLDEQNVLGPLQNEMQFRKVVDLVEDAKKHGAKVALGGEKPLDYSRVDVGAREVVDLIGRIEHGVPS